MSIYFYLRTSIRLRGENENYWLLLTIFNRFRKEFKLFSRTLEFLIFRKRKPFRFIFLEIVKSKNDFPRDILLLLFLKINPKYIKLWIQLIIDNIFLEKKIFILQSALIFFPLNKILLNFLKMVIGNETTSNLLNCSNQKKIQFNNNNTLDLKNFIKKEKILTGYLKMCKFNFIKVDKLKYICNLNRLMYFSFVQIQELHLLCKNKKKKNSTSQKNTVFFFKSNGAIFGKLFRFKFFKVHNNLDRIVLNILKLKQCKSLNTITCSFTNKKKNFNFYYNKIYYDIFKNKMIFFGGFLKHCNKQKILKKNCCYQAFETLLRLKFEIYFRPIIFTKFLRKVQTEIRTINGSIRLINFRPFRSNIGLIEKNLDRTKICQSTFFSFTYIPIYKILKLIL